MDMKDSGERQNFETGAVRDAAMGKPRPDLISPHAAIREGHWLRMGADKYRERNWESGMPISRCIASLERHLAAFKLGQADEDHMAAIRCNAGFILHFEEEIKAGRLPASLDDMPHYAGRNALEQTVQAALDKTFGDPDTMYAAEDIPAGAPIKVVVDLDDLQRRISNACNGEIIPVSYEEYSYLNKSGWAFARKAAPGVSFRNPSGATLRYVGPVAESRSSETSCSPEIGARFTVYLCGPITGDDIDYAWRNHATLELKTHGIKTLDPLRGKKPAGVQNQGLSYKGQLAAPETAERDRMDIEEADVIFAHFPYNPPRQSVGSLMEMGAAAIGFKKPVILCSDVKVFNEHLFCRNFCTLEPDFEQALQRIIAMAQVKRR
jgi:hypothetical protein